MGRWKEGEERSGGVCSMGSLLSGGHGFAGILNGQSHAPSGGSPLPCALAAPPSICVLLSGVEMALY